MRSQCQILIYADLNFGYLRRCLDCGFVGSRKEASSKKLFFRLLHFWYHEHSNSIATIIVWQPLSSIFLFAKNDNSQTSSDSRDWLVNVLEGATPSTYHSSSGSCVQKTQKRVSQPAKNRVMAFSAPRQNPDSRIDFKANIGFVLEV